MEKKYRLIDNNGLNARVASKMVGAFNKFPANKISVTCNNRSADGKSILSLITLVARKGEELNVSVSGEHAEDVFVMLEKTLATFNPPVVEIL